LGQGLGVVIVVVAPWVLVSISIFLWRVIPSFIVESCSVLSFSILSGSVHLPSLMCGAPLGVYLMEASQWSVGTNDGQISQVKVYFALLADMYILSILNLICFLLVVAW